MNSHRLTLTWTLAAATLVGAPAIASSERDPDPRESYSYVRVLEGRATLASQGQGPGEEAEIHQPLQAGDRVSVERGARVEIALADRNLLRVGGDTSLTLTRIAFSSDLGDRATRLDLEEGEIVLEVTADALGDSLPEVATPGAEVVVHEPGSYRVETDRSGWTELVVRDGFAELVTARGSTVVRGGEAATTYGERWSGVEISAAGSEDSLERWGSELLARARTSSAAELHVEPELAYGAAPLREWGTWVSYDSDWYWRPRVGVDWRPYWQGRWAWTPSGLTWVSSEPWGWVPYHYGAWSRIPGYGWAWRPGRVYSPAWVYWHWSDSWVGWVPVGYYTGWYGPGYYGSGFRFGVYGWSSGGWDLYTSWNFGPTDCLRRRHQRDHYRRGGDLARELGPRVPRGLVTTDTRGLPRHGFADEGVGSRELLRRAQRRIDRTPLVDVTDFVGRRRDLPPPVERAIRTEPGAKIRLADVPRAEMDSELQGRTVPRRDRVGDVVPVQGGGGSRVGRSDPVAGGALGEPSPRDRDRARVAPGGEVERGRPAVAPRAPAEGTDLNPRYDLERRGVPNPRPEAPRAPAEGTDFNPRYDLERRGVPNPRPEAPSDRQGWRRDPGVQTGAPPAGGGASSRPPTPRLAPGERAEIERDGTVRRVPPGRLPAGSGSAGPAVGARSSETGRQGWKSTEGWTGPRARTSTGDRSDGAPPSAPATRRDDAVQRVFGGLRRNETSTPRTLPPSSAYRRPDSRSVTPSTRSAPPSRTAPSPRTSPTPRVTPPARSDQGSTSSTRTAPPPTSQPSTSPPPSGSRGNRSSGASRSSGQKSASRDSPPPRRKRDSD